MTMIKTVLLSALANSLKFVDSRDKQTTYSNQSWSQTDDGYLQLARATFLTTGSYCTQRKKKIKSNKIPGNRPNGQIIRCDKATCCKEKKMSTN